MDINQAFPSDYLKASDVADKRINVTLERVEMKEMSDGEVKPVLYFRGSEKGLVLNKTNANTLAGAYGIRTEEWAGKKAVLFTVDTEFAGRRMKGIRIDPVHEAPEPSSAESYTDELDDPVPEPDDDSRLPF